MLAVRRRARRDLAHLRPHRDELVALHRGGGREQDVLVAAGARGVVRLRPAHAELLALDLELRGVVVGLPDVLKELLVEVHELFHWSVLGPLPRGRMYSP